MFTDHDKIRNDTVIHVWRNDYPGYWQQLMKNVCSMCKSSLFNIYTWHVTGALKGYADINFIFRIKTIRRYLIIFSSGEPNLNEN